MAGQPKILSLLKMVQISEAIDTNISGSNFFDPKLTRPQFFQTELTRLSHLLSFASLFITCISHIDIICTEKLHQEKALTFIQFGSREASVRKEVCKCLEGGGRIS